MLDVFKDIYEPFSAWYPLKGHIRKQTCSWKLQVCLSMYDLLVDTKH